MNKDITYTYYMRLRPPSIGTHPRGTISINPDAITINGYQYHGSVTYNRPLTDDELYNYDLDKILSDEEISQRYYEFLKEIYNDNDDEIEYYLNSIEEYNNFIENIL